MIYTKDNPKIVDSLLDLKTEEKFTGVVKNSYNNIFYYLDGKIHREDGPAIEYADGIKRWCLNDKSYGWNNDFTNESWIRFVNLEFLK